MSKPPRLRKKTVHRPCFIHPLQPLVLSLFTDRQPAHDRVSVSLALSDAITSPSRVRAAYIAVAEDVLRVMHAQGLIEKDALGWYWRAGQRQAARDWRDDDVTSGKQAEPANGARRRCRQSASQRTGRGWMSGKPRNDEKTASSKEIANDKEGTAIMPTDS